MIKLALARLIKLILATFLFSKVLNFLPSNHKALRVLKIDMCCHFIILNEGLGLHIELVS